MSQRGWTWGAIVLVLVAFWAVVWSLVGDWISQQ